MNDVYLEVQYNVRIYALDYTFSEIYLNVTQHVISRNKFDRQTHHTFWRQVKFLFLLFFPITALWNSSNWNVIQQIKTVAL